MKTELEIKDIDAIVDRLINRLKPLLSSNDNNVGTILDKKGLSEYLQVDVSWIDKNLYQLPYFKVGKYIRFKQSHIDRWIQGIEKTPSPYLKLMKNVK